MSLSSSVTDNTSVQPSVVTAQDTQSNIPMGYISSESPLTTNEQTNPITSLGRHVTAQQKDSITESPGTTATDVADNDNNYRYQRLQVTNPLNESPMLHQRAINGFSDSNGRSWPSVSPTSRKLYGKHLPIRSSHSPDETEV